MNENFKWFDVELMTIDKGLKRTMSARDIRLAKSTDGVKDSFISALAESLRSNNQNSRC